MEKLAPLLEPVPKPQKDMNNTSIEESQLSINDKMSTSSKRFDFMRQDTIKSIMNISNEFQDDDSLIEADSSEDSKTK